MTVTIREAKSADMEAFARIYKEIYDTTYREFLDPRLIRAVLNEDSVARMRADWLAPGAEMFAAEAEDGQILGFVYGFPSPDVLGAFWLEKLYLTASARGLGLGRRLIGIMEQRAREQGYSGMVIDVFTGNDHAEQIYRHLGARMIREDHLQDVCDMPVHSKLLYWAF
ncbi:MAG: GNAT family N-acetyltransferase [Mogibacterium sp.]|nr:GNAT family N-acetyltransferase [Mogibacterium sp.]